MATGQHESSTEPRTQQAEPTAPDVFRQPTRSELVGLAVVMLAFGVFMSMRDGAGWFTFSVGIGAIGIAVLALASVVFTAVDAYVMMWLAERGWRRNPERQAEEISHD